MCDAKNGGRQNTLATAVCYWWWGKALSVMPVSQAGQIVSFVPIVAVFMSAAYSGERITFSVIASIALIGTGIFLTLRGK